jgi:hypothetical protein
MAHAYLRNASSFSPLCFTPFFLFLFLFFFIFWESGVTQGISMTAISEPLASCWHVVLALDCYTKREMDRVRKSIEVHLLAIFILFRFKRMFPRDVGQGVQC